MKNLKLRSFVEGKGKGEKGKGKNRVDAVLSGRQYRAKRE